MNLNIKFLGNPLFFVLKHYSDWRTPTNILLFSLTFFSIIWRPRKSSKVLENCTPVITHSTLFSIFTLFALDEMLQMFHLFCQSEGFPINEDDHEEVTSKNESCTWMHHSGRVRHSALWPQDLFIIHRQKRWGTVRKRLSDVVKDFQRD